MALPSKDTKENFRLLDLSSEDLSDDLQLEIISNRRKKITRRDRNRLVQHKTSESTIAREAQCVVVWAIRGCLVLWLLLLTLMCATLYDQMSGMRLEVVRVSTSSNSVEDALQLFHTAAKELRANASDLSNRMTKLEQEHLELSKRVEKALVELAGVSGQLNAAPELREIPQRLNDLQKTVGVLGSQINGFDGAINTARKQAVTAATGVEEVKTLLHQLEARTNDTITNVTDNVRHGDELRQQVLAVNTTLEAKVEALKTRIEEFTRTTTTTAAPTSSTSTTTSSPISSTSTTTPEPTAPPGPPAKPSFTQ